LGRLVELRLDIGQSGDLMDLYMGRVLVFLNRPLAKDTFDVTGLVAL